MADTKLADLTALTAPSGDDLLYVVDDPAGTPADRKLALDNLFTRGTVTASSPIIDAAQTWNNAAVTFTSLKLNVTNTASASASLLLDLQVGGSSRVSIRNDGFVQLNGTGASLAASSCGVGTAGSGIFTNGSNSGGYYLGSVNDILLTRRAAANLRFGAADAAAPVAQTLSVQSVVAGTTNTAGANLTITGSQGTGTGAGGSIIFQVAPAGSSGTAQNALATALTINPAGTLTLGTNYFIRGSGADTGLAWTGNAPYLFNASTQIGISTAVVWFSGTTSSFPALKRVSANLQVIAADNAGSAGLIVGNQALATNATDGFLYVPTCAGTPTGTPTTQTGTVPIVVDTTNNKLYFYSSSAWRDAGP